jgi:preprotein translocase subunit SecG
VKPTGIEVGRVGFLTPFRTYIQIIQIILGIALIVSILLQTRGAGLGSVFGGTGTVFKTRRGIDRMLFRMTIGFITSFCIISLISAMIPT